MGKIYAQKGVATQRIFGGMGVLPMEKHGRDARATLRGVPYLEVATGW